jgi:hypothetical protein
VAASLQAIGGGLSAGQDEIAWVQTTANGAVAEYFVFSVAKTV